MSVQTINLKCPHCGAKLRAKMVEGIEKKSPICPICKEKSPFADYIKDTAHKDESATDYGITTNANATQALGHLRVVNDAKATIYNLQEGKNIIGRKASVTNATIQLELPAGANRISREHIVINVVKTVPNVYKHSVSLYKQQVNETFVCDIELEYGICLVLKHGDIIKMPDITLRFECKDDEVEEATELQC